MMLKAERGGFNLEGIRGLQCSIFLHVAGGECIIIFPQYGYPKTYMFLVI